MIAIKGFKMPQGCDSCLMQDDEGYRCILTCGVELNWLEDYTYKRHESCPLVEISDHVGS